MVFSRDFGKVTNRGQLNSQQFALAMYQIHKKVFGVDPPQRLSPEIMPPSMSTSSAGMPVATGKATVGIKFLFALFLFSDIEGKHSDSTTVLYC